MAKRKLNDRQKSRYLSLAFPEFIELNDYNTSSNDEENTANSNNINNMSGALRRGILPPAIDDVAGGPVRLPSPGVTQNVNPLLQATQPAQPSNIGLNIPSLIGSHAPIMFGNANINNVARAVLSDDKLPTARETALKITPEEKLMASIANTNPTPQSLWKRLLAGVATGAGKVTQEDNLGSAFGKILGSAVTRAIPAVDSANLYEERKGKAIERYKIDKGVQDADFQRRKNESDLSDAAEDRKLKQAARERQLRLDIESKLERLTDNRRADAKLQLDALAGLPEDDKQRDVISKELADKYGVKVGRAYGLVTKPATEKELSEDELRKRAEAQVIEELGATTEERARGAAANQLDGELRAQMPPDLYNALTDPQASQFEREAAIKLRNTIEDRVIKRNLDYTKSDFERRVTQRINAARGTNTTRKSRGKQGGKVPATNAPRGAVDYRKLQPSYTLK